MQVLILGQVGISSGETDLPLAGSKRKALLAILALKCNRVVSADSLVDHLWGDNPPVTAANTLQSHMSHLRKVLGPSSAVLVSRSNGYMLQLERTGTDLGQFEMLTEQAAATDHPMQRVEFLRHALSCWRGPAFADVTDIQLLHDYAMVLEERKLAATEDLLDARLAVGEHTHVVAELEALTGEHPFRERLWAQLIVALYRSGRQAEALRAYSRLREKLAEELGIDPSPALRDLESSVLSQDAGLDWTAPPHKPPPRSGRTGSFRTPPTRFVGRRDELVAIQSALVHRRLLTVVGAGGVGKTRLALEAANQVVGHFPDGLALVELAESGAQQVWPLVAASFGVTAESGQPLPSTVCAGLADRHALLVLDNCEHVIDVCADLVNELLGTCPYVTILATSREPLRASGEVCFSLEPLPVPSPADESDADALTTCASVELLVDRAYSVSPQLGLAADRAAVAQICRRLDGLPLALELAAARLRTMTPTELAGGLSDRFELLATGMRTAPERHRTLRRVIDWSHELLSEEEQRTLRRLAVFAGGTHLRQVDDVCGRSAGRIALDLADKSLVMRSTREADTRLTLHETVRQYASERLHEAGELENTSRAHALAFVRLAEEMVPQLHSVHERTLLDRFEIEHENLLAALAYCRTASEDDLGLRLARAMWWFWFRTNRAREGHDWLREVLADVETSDPEPLAEALAAAGYLGWVLDEFDAAEDLAERALTVVGAANHSQALAFGVRARVAGDRGNPVAAMGDAATSVELYRAAGDTWGAAWASRCLASAARLAGDATQAKRLCEEVLDVFAEHGDQWATAGTLDLLASTNDALGEYRLAVQLAREAVTSHRRLGDTSGTRYSLHHLAVASKHVGDNKTARMAALESLEVSRTHGYRLGAAYALLLLAELDRDSGRIGDARSSAVEAAALARELGDVELGKRASSFLA
jgi:predicted ATPase/DNA-binding SARP family transcriptional activator